MKRSYNKILDISICHSYYSDGICRGLKFVPSSTTNELFKKFGLRLVETLRGCEVYVPTSFANLKSFFNYIKKESSVTSFVFSIISSNEHFFEITDSPTKQTGCYFCTTSNSIDIEEGKKEFVNTFKPELCTDCVCELEIEFDDLLLNTDYNLNFSAKKTQWNYLIINRSRNSFGKLHIEGKPNIEFLEPKNVVLENGQEAISFVSSDKAIPLKEDQDYELNLLGTISNLDANRTKIIYKGLPSPDPAIATISKNGNGNIVRSLMYVYLYI